MRTATEHDETTHAAGNYGSHQHHDGTERSTRHLEAHLIDQHRHDVSLMRYTLADMARAHRELHASTPDEVWASLPCSGCGGGLAPHRIALPMRGQRTRTECMRCNP